MSLVALVLSLLLPAADVEHLRATAPTYLTEESARENLADAVVAGVVERVSPAMLLSIAWHESRYWAAAITPEVGGLDSCGVMTPEPLARCSAESWTLIGGYLEGARHLRTWLDACRGDERCALLGYAGGYRLIDLCRRRDVRACHTPDVFRRRASWISG